MLTSSIRSFIMAAHLLFILLSFRALYCHCALFSDGIDGPYHVHLSYGDDPDHMIVTWNTRKLSGSSVKYGRDSKDLEKMQDGTVNELKQDDNVQYVHKVNLKSLESNQTYYYQCGINNSWSAIYHFTTMPSGVNWSPRLAVFGDMGYENAQSLQRLIKDSTSGMYDAILHVGDFAYDMDSEEGHIGDKFMAEIEPISSIIPYMTVPGNHESWGNFYHYKQRFSMPQSDLNMYYSFNLGPIHFICVSTEYYYFVNYGISKIFKQFRWLENDLKDATKPEVRLERPWIVMLGHRPMYCSDLDTDDCTRNYTMTRVGIPFVHWFGIEPLLWKYGVDLVVWAHEHTYERLWPVYDTKVYNGSLDHPYTNPGAPVHVVTGSAGCKERTDKFVENPPPWSAFRSSDYGYSRMTVPNKTHLYMEQVSDDQDGKVIDSFWLIKNKHESYEHKN